MPNPFCSLALSDEAADAWLEFLESLEEYDFLGDDDRDRT